jgi:hypothetical protein
MPAANELQARLDECRAILKVEHDPAAHIWNKEMRLSHRRLLLLAADLPETFTRDRWEDLPEAYRNRIKAAPARFSDWARRMNFQRETCQ